MNYWQLIRKYWPIAAAILWAVGFVFWVSSIPFTAPPDYIATWSEPVNYSQLLSKYASPSSSGLLRTCGIFQFSAIALVAFSLYKLSRWLVWLVIIPVIITNSFCFATMSYAVYESLNSPSISLEHLHTEQFDGHVYHLTLGNGSTDDWIGYIKVFLFQCDSDDNLCHACSIYTEYQVDDFELDFSALYTRDNQLQIEIKDGWHQKRISLDESISSCDELDKATLSAK